MPVKSLEAELAEIRARLEAKVKAELDELASKIRGDSAQPAGGGEAEARKTGFDKVKEFLEASGPQTRAAIVAATGVTNSALSQILYRTHPDHFISVTAKGFERKKVWALRDEAGKPMMDLFGDEVGEFAGVD